MHKPTQNALDQLRQTAREVAAALEAAGLREPASKLREAILGHGSAAENLLAMRSALVSTRNRWERLGDAALVARARAALGAAKRLAIEL